MAQRIDALKFRLGNNSLWLSQWHSNTKEYANLFFEDHLIRHYLSNIFDIRGFLCKRCLIKRFSKKVFIFLEFYSNTQMNHQIPRFHRDKNSLRKVIKLKSILRFLNKIAGNEVYINFKNMFIVNKIHRKYVRRLRGLFAKFRRYKFTLNVLAIFNITIRNRSIYFLSKIISNELTMVNFKKRDKKIWKFVSFCRGLVNYISGHNTNLRGMRIHLKGRFKGIKRSRLNRYIQGNVPFNTIKAKIDYCRSYSATVNGSFGVHIWGCFE
jgi:hypothetical protein